MENNGKSLFDRLSDQDSKLEEILSTVESLKENSNKTTLPNYNSNNIVKNFLVKSKKEYFWFGPIEEFNKSKNKMLIIQLMLFIIGIISTIITSKACKIYTTFTLFENIWLFASIFVTIYVLKRKRRMNDFDLMSQSIDIYEKNSSNTWINTLKEKKKYRIIRRISYACSIMNIIYVWITTTTSIAIWATLFEILFIVATFLSMNFYSDLDCMYGDIIIFTGRNNQNKYVSIVSDPFLKKLVPLDEFKENHKNILTDL